MSDRNCLSCLDKWGGNLPGFHEGDCYAIWNIQDGGFVWKSITDRNAMSLIVRPADRQIAISQAVMKCFVDLGTGTFESFLASWKSNSGSAIWESASPRPLLYGSVQTAYSTFIGFCQPARNDLEKRGGIFGLYVTHSIHFSRFVSPILISPREMTPIAEFCHSDAECASILASMLNAGHIAFSAVPVAIHTRSATNPPPVVVDDRVPSNSIFVTAREIDEKKRNSEPFCEPEDDLRSQYDDLMQRIRSFQ